MEREDFTKADGDLVEGLVHGAGISGIKIVGRKIIHIGIFKRLKNFFFANRASDKAGRFVVGNAVKPGAKGFGSNKVWEFAIDLDPDFLVHIERCLRLSDETAQVVKQGALEPPEQLFEGASITGLGSQHQQSFLASRKVALPVWRLHALIHHGLHTSTDPVSQDACQVQKLLAQKAGDFLDWVCKGQVEPTCNFASIDR